MKKKVFALIAAVAAVLIAVLVLGLSRCVGDYGQIVISLSQKDATVDVADSFQLQLVSDEGVNVDDLQVTWISNKSFIASVNENGTVLGVGAGEAKISAIVQYKDKEYITSCRVTVTPTQEEPSVYRIRYYTQKRDRSGYDIVEDVYESAVGMQINLTDTDISHKLPENYVVNKEKSILSHTVTENKSACVLEVYYDVAKISYTVEAHYESPKKLETYGSTVKQEIEVYAFSPVTLPAPREGFVLNEKAKGSILQDDSIVAGEKLVAYYDRIRSEVKVTFINKPQATYKAVYGIGLVNGKFSDLTDSTELFNVTAYVDNQQVKLTEDYLRKLTADTHISFGVDGQGFYYVADGGVLVNCNYEKTKDSYVYLKGSGSTVYLSATADLTGSGSNIFGITIRSGDQTREVRFQDHGVSVMENHTAEVGTVSGDRDQYTRANWHEDANVYAQNAAGAHYNTYRSSAVNSMVTQRTESSHQIVWTIWEGTLYCSVDGHISLRLPLYHLDPNWTADKTYEIGFSAYDYRNVGDELRFRDICVKFDAEAEKMLVLNNQVKAADFEDMHYQPITGTYLPTIDYGSSYLYLPAITGNGGIRADISWVNKDNSYASPGVTVKVGDVSHYFMVEGMNFWARHFTAVKESIVKMTDTYGHVVRYSKPFDDAGMCKLQAFVKDGKLHILYNGAQAYCIEMKDLFEGYTNKSKVSFGIYCLDGLGGLAHFANVKPVTGQDVQGIDLKDWAFYSENYYTDDLDMAQGKMSQTAQMSEGRFVEVYGEAATWQVEALMKRTDTAYDQDLPMGLRIQAGDKTATVFGGYNGFAVNEKWNELSQGSNRYAFNNKTTASFFATPRTTDQISFKAVIYKDVLYVWLDGQPCWRLPLTEEYFGGFAAGSKYKIGLAFAGWQGAGETGTMENIQIKSDSQVTGQIGFADTLAKLNANIDRWSELRLGHIYGADAESFTVDYGTWDHAYGYFAPAKGDMGLKVTTGWTDPAAGNTWSRVGITLKVGDISHQFVLEEEHSEVKHFTNFTDAVNISSVVKAHVEPFKADKSSDMTAVIKDGKLYLLYNGKQGYCVDMKTLFPGYTADSEVSLGICNLDSQTGIGTFNNIKLLNAKQVADIAVTPWTLWPSDCVLDSADLVAGMIGQSAQMTEGRYIMFCGEDTTWQVEALMKRTDTAYDQDLPMGLRIQAGDKTATVFGGYNGFAVNEKWNEISQGGNLYAFNNKTTASFFAVPRTTDQISFKAVIHKDVLYVWLDGQPCWRLPLTEEYFGGFAAGSKYKIGLAFAGWQGAGETGTMENIQIKSGSQVTEQNGFADTLATLNANIDRWNELHLGHIYGKDAESFSVNSATWDNAYGYFAPAKGDMGLKVTTGWTDPAAGNTWSRVGITLKVGDISHQFVLEEEHSEVKHFTNFTDAVNISSVVKAHVEPFKADKSSDMTAVIKDGKLYLLYNGKQGYCVDMKTLFPGYTADSEVSLGICNLDSQTGIGTFNNIKLLNAKQVADIAVTPWTLWPSDYVLDSADLVAGMIGQSAQMTEGRYIMFCGEDTTWQVEALMKRTDTAYDQDLPMGLRIQAGDKTATVFGGYNGFAVNEKWNEISQGGNLYAFNNKTTASFFAVPRTTDQISFKAVIHKDVLYVWLDGQPCWRLPLTEEYFGGFAAGSKYKIGLAFAGWQGAGETGTMENIQIKSGSQVTEQNGFADTLATLNANIDRWNELHLGHIYGKDAESFSVNSATWDNAYGYFAPAKGDMGLKVTTGWTDPAAGNTWSRVGITVKVGDFSHQFVLEEQHSEVKHFTNFGDAVNISADVMRYVNPFKADRSCDMMALIRDGKLYLYYNGVQGYMVSMGQLFTGYTADSDVSLGICNLDSQTGIGTFENIEILSAQDVAVQAATGDLVANMNYDSMTGAYLPVTQNGPAYLYGAPIVGNQAISTTIHYYNGEISNNGITIKIGDQSVQVVGDGGDNYMRIWKNQGESPINKFPHPMTVNNIYSQIKAVINNGKLYLFYNGAQMNPINLTELFPSYQTTDAIALGIYSHNAQADWVRFTDTQFHTTAAQVDSLVRFYVASNSDANMDTANGNIVKNGYAQVQLEGVSNVWEVTGTLYNYVPGNYLQPAFEVRDTNGAGVQAMIDGNGIQFPWGDYRENDPYCINPNTGHFHWWGINEMDFRIVVANDILYAWFETAGDGNLIATWHIPLTEYYNGTTYGGCAAGSQYTFKFLLGGEDAVNGKSGLMNVIVRTGENASTEGIW